MTDTITQKQRAISERSLENLKPFPKGTSGHPGGRRRGASVTSSLRRLLTKDEANEIATTWIAQAKGGSYPHLRELLLRIDGPVEPMPTPPPFEKPELTPEETDILIAKFAKPMAPLAIPIFKPVREIDFNVLRRLDEDYARRLSQKEQEQLLSAGIEPPGVTE
jgi:hypothetical protein